MTNDEFWTLAWPEVQASFRESVTHAISDALQDYPGSIEFELALYFWNLTKSHVDSWVSNYEVELARQLETRNLGYWKRSRERRKNLYLVSQYRRMLELTATDVFKAHVRPSD